MAARAADSASSNRRRLCKALTRERRAQSCRLYEKIGFVGEGVDGGAGGGLRIVEPVQPS
jgi:hypothetical protein